MQCTGMMPGSDQPHKVETSSHFLPDRVAIEKRVYGNCLARVAVMMDMNVNRKLLSVILTSSEVPPRVGSEFTCAYLANHECAEV